MTTSTGASAPVVFTFTTQPLRVVMIDGNPWFVAADVCAALGIGNNRMAVEKLDDDEKGVSSIDTLGGKQEMLVVNESGLNAIILRCRDAMTTGTVAHRYRKWVTSEVLPSIRKTGAYIAREAMRPALTAEQQREISDAVRKATTGWIFGDGSQNWIYNHLRVAFNVARWQDIPTDQHAAAMALIESKDASAKQFLVFLRDVRDYFDREVLGGNLPWTPSIQKKLSQEMGRRVILPPKVDWLALAEKHSEGKTSCSPTQ